MDDTLRAGLDLETARELNAYIEERSGEWVRRLRQYIEIPSAFRPPPEVSKRTRVCLTGGMRERFIPHHHAMARRLAEDLSGLGLRVTVDSARLPGDEIGIPYVRARTRGSGPVGLLFSSHYDVVGASRETWGADPFAAVERDGVVYGRGASDAKGPLSAMVSAYQALAGLGLSPARGIEFVFTGDEEFGGRRGVRSEALSGTLEAMACVVGEPSAVRGERTVAVMTKGRVEGCLAYRQAASASGHSALSDTDSALERLVDALYRLRSAAPRLVGRFRDLSTRTGIWSRLARAEPQVRILNIVQPSTSASGNIVGNVAEGRVEVRFHPPMSGELVADWLRSVLAELEDPMLEVSLTTWNEAGVLSPERGLHTAVMDLGRQVGLELEVAAFPAGSDMSPLVNLHRLPTCIASCVDQTNAIHGDNERVSTTEIVDSVKLYAALMLGFRGTSNDSESDPETT